MLRVQHAQRLGVGIGFKGFGLRADNLLDKDEEGNSIEKKQGSEQVSPIDSQESLKKRRSSKGNKDQKNDATEIFHQEFDNSELIEYRSQLDGSDHLIGEEKSTNILSRATRQPTRSQSQGGHLRRNEGHHRSTMVSLKPKRSVGGFR